MNVCWTLRYLLQVSQDVSKSWQINEAMLFIWDQWHKQTFFVHWIALRYSPKEWKCTASPHSDSPCLGQMQHIVNEYNTTCSISCSPANPKLEPIPQISSNFHKAIERHVCTSWDNAFCSLRCLHSQCNQRLMTEDTPEAAGYISESLNAFE